MKRAFHPDRDVATWKGANAPYDIIKEGVIALVAVLALTMGLAFVFSSPDEKAVTLRDWSTASPVDFVTTAYSELAGTSGVATYGAPYNATVGPGMSIGPLHLQKWVGVHIPINTTRDYVLLPLASLPDRPDVTAALTTWREANAATRTSYLNAYNQYLNKITFVNGHLTNPGQLSGPVPVMMDGLLSMARTGALDQALIAESHVFVTNYTKPLLFLADGSWFGDLASRQHLAGDQWGMMNETGSYPGQAWLWLYTFWYQVAPFNSSGNADALVFGLMIVLTTGLIFLPFIPGLRSIPRWTKVYRLIWREHYRRG